MFCYTIVTDKNRLTNCGHAEFTILSFRLNEAKNKDALETTPVITIKISPRRTRSSFLLFNFFTIKFICTLYCRI